jgi:hypothetical protein
MSHEKPNAKRKRQTWDWSACASALQLRRTKRTMCATSTSQPSTSRLTTYGVSSCVVRGGVCGVWCMVQGGRHPACST